MATNVKKLDQNVQSQLRSDLTTHSVTNCVVELVENAIDAQSSSIAIRINLQKFQLQVIDNGCGMTREQLKTIGKRNCTSKWNLKSKSKLFGYRGESLANLRKSCDLLLIITRTAESTTTFCKEFTSDGSSRVEEALQERISQGTTVIAKNVLGKTPVRQARIIPSVEFQNIKQYIRATAIMYPLICFSLEDSSKSVELLRIKRAKTVQKQLKNLYPEIYETSTMLKLAAERGSIRVKAIVSDRMCKYKSVRFVYVNRRYVAKTDIEKFFKNCLQKCFREMKTKEALEVRSRWQPVFVLNITCPADECCLHFELNKRHVEFKNRPVVNHCLVELLNEFRGTFGLEKTSFGHRAPASYVDDDRTNAKNTFTFIDGKLYQKLKDAPALFGISTARPQVHRYRHSRYPTMKRDVKPLNEDQRRFRFDRRVTGQRDVDAEIPGAARSTSEPKPECPQDPPIDHHGEDSDSFESVFRASNEHAIGRDKARGSNVALSRASRESKNKEDNRTKKARVSTGERQERESSQRARSSRIIDEEKNKSRVSTREGQKREREPSLYVASSGKVDIEEDIFWSPLRTKDHEERERFFFDDGLFGVDETDTVPKTPSKAVENIFDASLPSIQHSEIFPIPTNVPNSPQEKLTENVSSVAQNVKNDTIIVEDNLKDRSPLAASVTRMLMNCVQQKCDNDTQNEQNSSFIRHQSQSTKTILLRESKLKIHGPFDSEFALKPTDKTFVNYLEQRSSSAAANVTKSDGIREPFPQSCLHLSDTSRYVDNKMTKLTLKTRTSGPGNSFCIAQEDASPECYCSCHKMDTENTHARESPCGPVDFCDEVQSVMPEVRSPASNPQVLLSEENPPPMSAMRNFPFTPYVASPYFLKSTSQVWEGENMTLFRDTPPTSDLQNEAAMNEYRDSPVLRVVDDLSLKTLKKKMRFKRNCKMLSSAGAVDIPSGLLEASRPVNKKSTVFRAVGEDFRKFVKPYSVKNHYTLDDDGRSCLRLFPHLRKNDEQPTTNSLTIPEELNSFFPFTKCDLRNIEFLVQVDRKFLLTIMHKIDTNEEIIVIFDQHAVDERIRLEQLFETYTDKYGVWKSTSVNPAIYPDVTSCDLHILCDFRTHFEEKGLYFKFNKGDTQFTQRFLIAVVKVPTCLHCKAMRESSSLDFGSKLTELVESLIKEMVELLSEPLGAAQNLPQTLCEALNYEACRGAVKFGDELSEKVCVTLLKKVSNCECPFQCAHGRPVLAPLISLTKIETFMATRSFATRSSAKRIGRLSEVERSVSKNASYLF